MNKKTNEIDTCFQYANGKNIRFDGIKYYVIRGRDKRFILKDISGIFKSGELSAIMGPSGSGKSSLMNILAGYRTKNVSGNILINTEERNANDFRKMSCYIMQDDLLLPHLSVAEVMMCSANLKLNEKISFETKTKIVNDILNSLGLSDATHVRTANLSGGQKKRLAIAQELVNNPPVMFFDEPTSGLDSASCYQCIALLRTLARGGRTVICTIHQPSAKIFEMFDNLYFLTDGHCIYRGPVNSLVPYLASHDLICPSYHNPADYCMEVACGEHGDNVLRLACSVRRSVVDDPFVQSCKPNQPSVHSTSNINSGSPTKLLENADAVILIQNKSSHVNSNAINSDQPSHCSINLDSQLAIGFNGSTTRSSSVMFKPNSLQSSQNNAGQRKTFEANLWTQFCVLFIRSLRSIVRDATLTHLRFVSHVIVGVLIGLLYFRIGNLGHEVISNAAFLFFSLLFIMFAALMPTVMTFPLEMPIFIREHMNYWYSLKAYYLAKSFADIPFQIIFPVLYGSIVYWMTGQPADCARFLLFLVMSVLTSLVGQSLGLVIGAATSLQVAVFLGPVTSIPMLLFSGFFLSLDLIPKYLQWLSYISFTRYSFAGTLKIVYGLNRTDLDCVRRVSNRVAMPCIRRPSAVLDLLKVGNYGAYVDILILCIFFILLRVLAYFILRWRIKGQR